MKIKPGNKSSVILQEERGAALVITLFVVIMLTFLGLAGLMVTNTDIQISANYYSSTQGLSLAEAGLERAMADLIYDLGQDQNISNSSFSRRPGSPAPNPLPINPSSSSFYNVFSGSLGDGTYSVDFKNVGTSPNFSSTNVFVRSTGLTNNGSQKLIESYLEAENVNVWNNAIFSAGGSGVPINGNVKVAGSVHILGTGLAPCNGGAGGTAVDIQTGNVFNGHTGNGGGNNIDATLDDYVNYAGWSSTNLDTKFRVKKGCVDMSVGSGTMGAAANSVKGIYVGNGDDGDSNGVNDDILGGDNEGAGQNLYSKNRTKAAYDLGNVNINFPSIDTTGLDANSLDATTCAGTPTGNLKLEASTNSFSCTDGTRTISWDKDTLTITINGIIKLDEIEIETDIKYSGKGTLYSTDTDADDAVKIKGDILPASTASYPTTNVIGIIATGGIEFDKANLIAAGAFYSAQTITPKKQTEIVGTIVSDNFNLGSQVPKIWQVPSLANNLPPGMPGSTYIWVFTTRRWREVIS